MAAPYSPDSATPVPTGAETDQLAAAGSNLEGAAQQGGDEMEEELEEEEEEQEGEYGQSRCLN